MRGSSHTHHKDVFKPHEGPITRLRWDEKKQMLYTGGKDNSIKIWQFAERWYPFVWQELEKFSLYGKKAEAPGTGVEEEKKGAENDDVEEEDEEDDLTGWAK